MDIIDVLASTALIVAVRFDYVIRNARTARVAFNQRTRGSVITFSQKLALRRCRQSMPPSGSGEIDGQPGIP
eukprot:4330065-Amphidinium_carterae.1